MTTKAKSQKVKTERRGLAATRGIVAPDGLHELKRRAEEFGFILHVRPGHTGERTQGRGQKKKR